MLSDYLKILLHLLYDLISTADPPPCAVSTMQHAAKLIEAISAHPVAQAELVSLGVHIELLHIVSLPSTSLYIKKTLATALCNLAKLEANVPILGSAGAVGVLHAEQARAVESSPHLKRQKVQLALSRLSADLVLSHADALRNLSSEELALIDSLARTELEAREQPLHSVRASLIESGVLLYLHTAFGGAAWGLFESLRRGETRAVLIRNVSRTSLVTCFVPILMVGGVVTGYNEANKKSDSINEKFAVYFSICAAMYPCGR
ncbi:MAG: hypothetical protein SGPRY_010725 [Prymnesium sp.]